MIGSRDPLQNARVAERIERDALGELAVPAPAYYGIHTVRRSGIFRLPAYRSAR